MATFEPRIERHLAPVKLNRTDIEAILSILKDECKTITISSDRFEISYPQEEIPDIANPRHLRIETREPSITIDLDRVYLRLAAYRPSTLQHGLVGRLTEHLESHRPLGFAWRIWWGMPATVGWIVVGLGGLLVAQQFSPLSNTRAFMVAAATVIVSLSSFYATTWNWCRVNLSKAPSSRTSEIAKHPLAIAIVSAVVGAAVGSAVTAAIAPPPVVCPK